MTREQAYAAARERITASQHRHMPEWCWTKHAQMQMEGEIAILEALGVVKFDPTNNVPMIDCNCTSADECPQGYAGSHTRCKIPATNATIKGFRIADALEIERKSP